MAPEMLDDYSFKFKGNTRITSFGQILIYQYKHYLNSNGRAIVHTIIQIFDCLLGKVVFNLCNAVVFVLFLWLMVQLYRLRLTAMNLLLTFATLLFLLPAFGETMLWMSGSVNYLWSTVAVSAFLLTVETLKDKPLRKANWFLLFPALMAGWSHEGLSLPLAIGLGCYAIYHKSICRSAILPLFVGFMIGTLICTCAPGNVQRSGVEQMDATILKSMILSGVSLCLRLRTFYLLIGCFLLICVTERRYAAIRLCSFYKQEMVVCIAIVASFGMVFLGGMNRARAIFGTEFFSAILLMRFLGESFTIRRPAVIYSLICCATVTLCSFIVWFSVANWREYRRIVDQLEYGTSEIILYDHTVIPYQLKRYINSPLSITFFRCDNKFVRRIAQTYNRDRISFVPRIIYDDIVCDNPRLYDLVVQKEDYPFYCIAADSSLFCTVDYKELQISPSDYAILHICDRDWMFYTKPRVSSKLPANL